MMSVLFIKSNWFVIVFTHKSLNLLIVIFFIALAKIYMIVIGKKDLI